MDNSGALKMLKYQDSNDLTGGKYSERIESYIHL